MEEKGVIPWWGCLLALVLFSFAVALLHWVGP